MKNSVCIFILFLLCQIPVFSYEKNDLRTLFINNNSRIMGINIRTFNAKDINNNEIIDSDEESGNFLNAIERLDEIEKIGINTLHLLPITKVGRLKALGTAGSVYSMSNFSEINEQIVDKKSKLTPNQQAKKFIDECHKRNIRVIVDLPSCGAYDLYLTNPELFLKDDGGYSIVPSDWTDVRLFNTGNNKKLNKDLLLAHKKFVDLLFEIGADGIRADVATIKPYEFWVNIIQYAREKDSEFMFLAEASDSWREPPSKYAAFTPYNELLKAGFDGYYGSFFNLKVWNASEFIEHILFNKKLLSSYDEPKSVILSFTTHDEVSPVMLHGEQFSIMIGWLQAFLPYNTYIIDGFYSGDKYDYKWANTAANSTETDDDSYFVHQGKLDIFNFSRKPDGKNSNILKNFTEAYNFRVNNEQFVSNADFIPLKTSNEKVFAFIRQDNNKIYLIIGNFDFDSPINDTIVKNPIFNKKLKSEIVHGDTNIKLHRRYVRTNLNAGEIKIIKLK